MDDMQCSPFQAVTSKIYHLYHHLLPPKMAGNFSNFNWEKEMSPLLRAKALASHQCGPHSFPRLGVICGLSFLVLYSALRAFFPGYSGLPVSSKTYI